MARKLLMLIFVLSLSVNAFSQKKSSDDIKYVYTTTTEINVRESPPEKGIILVSGPGQVLFKLEKDSAVIVIDTRVIESVFSKTIWVKIRAVADSKKDGWIYWGDNEKESVNLKEKGVK